MNVWVTRDEDVDGALGRALREQHLTPVLEPVLERQALDDAERFIAELGSDDWLVLTSSFAIEIVARQPSRAPRVAVVGAPSEKLAIENGFRVELVSPNGTGKGLIDELQRSTLTGRVCYPRSSLVSPPTAWAEVELTSPVIYQTKPRAFDRGVINRIDLVTVVSASAVRAIGPIDRPFASIGPSTSAVLRELGVEPAIESSERSFASLAAAISDYADASRHQRA